MNTRESLLCVLCSTPGDSLIELAFYFMEKSKNQVLLEPSSNVASVADKKSGKITESLVALENSYRTRRVELQNTLYRLKFNNAAPCTDQ